MVDEDRAISWLEANPAFIHKNYTFFTDADHRNFVQIIYDVIMSQVPENYNMPGVDSINPIRLKDSDGIPPYEMTNPYANDLFNKLAGTGLTIDQHWGTVKTLINALAIGGQIDWKLYDIDLKEYGPIYTAFDLEPEPITIIEEPIDIEIPDIIPVDEPVTIPVDQPVTIPVDEPVTITEPVTMPVITPVDAILGDVPEWLRAIGLLFLIGA